MVCVPAASPSVSSITVGVFAHRSGWPRARTATTEERIEQVAEAGASPPEWAPFPPSPNTS
jgi:hypothetical protein